MATRLIDTDERRRRLGRAQWLGPTRRAGTVAALAGDLCGLHATDPASVFLAVRARIPGATVASIDSAWHTERTVVKALGMRRTVFVVESPWLSVMHAACTLAIERRERAAVIKLLEDSAVAADGARWLEAAEAEVVEVLRRVGEATGSELSKAVPRLAEKFTLHEGKAYGGSSAFSTRTLFLLGCAGVIVRGRPKGSWISSQHRWALAETALGHPIEPIPAAEAQATLARRWLAAFGPATANDLKWWTGWTLGEAKRALTAIGAVAVELDGGATGYVNADDLAPEPPATGSWLAFLPSLDPTAMGWSERDWYVGEHRPVLFDRSGNIGPTVWLDGRIVGGWAVRKNGEVVHRLLEDVGAEAARRAEAEAASVQEWLGATVVTPRFPTPVDRALRSEM